MYKRSQRRVSEKSDKTDAQSLESQSRQRNCHAFSTLRRTMVTENQTVMSGRSWSAHQRGWPRNLTETHHRHILCPSAKTSRSRDYCWMETAQYTTLASSALRYFTPLIMFGHRMACKPSRDHRRQARTRCSPVRHLITLLNKGNI